MKAAFFSLLIFLVIACNNKEDGPDISNINVDVKLERFESDFFSIDSNNVLPGLNQLNQKYPVLTNLFLQNILGLDSSVTLQGVRQFLHLSAPIYDSVKDVFKNTDWLQKDFQESFRYV